MSVAVPLRRDNVVSVDRNSPADAAFSLLLA